MIDNEQEDGQETILDVVAIMSEYWQYNSIGEAKEDIGFVGSDEDFKKKYLILTNEKETVFIIGV